MGEEKKKSAKKGWEKTKKDRADDATPYLWECKTRRNEDKPIDKETSTYEEPKGARPKSYCAMGNAKRNWEPSPKLLSKLILD